mgnify:FL=1
MSGISVDVQGIKEISQMFAQLPKQVNEDAVWGRFWKKVTVPLLKAAETNAPIAKKDVPYPPDEGLKIKRGTLKSSLKFYRTKASKGDIHGGYIGPRVKGKFKKNKGGYFGAWVEYGHKMKKGGTTKSNPFMEKSFREKSGSVLSNGFKDAEKIFDSALKRHENRLKKYGSLGY